MIWSDCEDKTDLEDGDTGTLVCASKLQWRPISGCMGEKEFLKDVDINHILDMLRAYMEEDEERSILITSHIASDLEQLCDDIYLIHNGTLILYEDTDVILEQYGVLKVSEDQFAGLDQDYLLKTQKTSYGYACFTNHKDYYQQNYPGIIVENGNIDELILMMTGGYQG